MFNRRMLVALAACLIVSASTAMAGGSGGTKKDSNVKVINNGPNPIYAFVNVSDAAIQAGANLPTADQIFAEFKRLGGKEIAAGGNSSTFAVQPGQNTVTAVDIVLAAPVGKKTVTTTKGKTTNVSFP